MHRMLVDTAIARLAIGLDVTSSIGVPETFALHIRSDAFETRRRVVSQTERHIEVEFC
ncbi:hypothetical protein [Mesorhizobium sp.]|uniref:hypothetical protein n=1 Tax=Mesorhizobium sp. TaxID=1871066 RepID=UPI0025BAE5A6|nr:hypothetical protein [Mesorhizobium sp.]